MLGNDALYSDVKETKLCFCRPASAELLFGYENNLSALTGTSDQRGSLWERVIKQSQVTYLTRRTIFLYLSASPVPEHSRVAGQQHVAGVGVAAAAVLRAGPRDGRHGDQDGRDLHRPPAPRLALGWGHADTSLHPPSLVFPQEPGREAHFSYNQILILKKVTH